MVDVDHPTTATTTNNTTSTIAPPPPQPPSTTTIKNIEDDCSVRVALRVRPLSTKEINERCEEVVRYVDRSAQVVVGKDQTFSFDYVFSTKSRQQEIYESCVAPLVQSLFQGYNSTILAYGQTGAGKTFTMGTESTVGIEAEMRGVIPRVIDHVFSMVEQEIKTNNKSIVLKVSFLELYNEEIRDMLSPMVENGNDGGLAIRETASGEVFIPGLFEEVVRTRRQMEDALTKGSLSRTTGSTLMNNQSSRSHAIFTIIVEQRDLNPGELTNGEPSIPDELIAEGTGVIRSKFHFVDLAGSERVKKTKAEGQRLKEGININSGLLALGNVISALGDTRRTTKPKHVPYRDSKLTRMLQSSLGGNSRTLMIACISPADSNFEETLNTLKYAYRARNIMNKPVVNVDPMTKQLNFYKSQIQILKDQLIHKHQYKESDIESLIGDIDISSISSPIKTAPILPLNDNNNNSSNNNNNNSSNNNNNNNASTNNNSNINHVMSPHKEHVTFQENMRISQLEFENNMLQEISNGVTQKYKEIVSRYKIMEGAAKEFLNGYSQSKDPNNDFLELFNSFDSIINPHRQQQDDGSDNEEDPTMSDSMDNDLMNQNDQISELKGFIVQKEEELEIFNKSRSKIDEMREIYEVRLSELSTQLSAVREEHENAMQALESKRNEDKNNDQPPNIQEYESEKERIKQYYEKKLSDLKTQLDNHMKSKKDLQRLLELKNKSEEKIDALNNDIREMKRQKTEMIKKMRDEMKKKDDAKLVQQRELDTLKKEQKKSELLIDQLKNQSKKKDILLQKKIDESEMIKKKLKNLESKPLPKPTATTSKPSTSTTTTKNNSSFKSKTTAVIQGGSKPKSTVNQTNSTINTTTTLSTLNQQQHLQQQSNWREWLQSQINRTLAKNEMTDTLDKYLSEKDMYVKESNRLKQKYSSAGNKMTRAEYNDQWQFIESNIRSQNEKISRVQKDLAVMSDDGLDVAEIMRKISTTPYEKLPSLIQASLELCVEYAENNKQSLQLSPSATMQQPSTSPSSTSSSSSSTVGKIKLSPSNDNMLEMRTTSSTLMQGIKDAKKQEEREKQQPQTIIESKLINEINQDHQKKIYSPTIEQEFSISAPPSFPTSITSSNDLDFFKEIEELQQKIRQSSLTFNQNEVDKNISPSSTTTTSTTSGGVNPASSSSSKTTESKVDQLLDELKSAKERSQNRHQLRRNNSGNSTNNLMTTISVTPSPPASFSSPMSHSLPANLTTIADDENIVFDQNILDVEMDTKKISNSPKSLTTAAGAQKKAQLGLSADSIPAFLNSPNAQENDVFARLSAPRPDSRLKKYRDKLKGDVYHQSISTRKQPDATDNFIRSNWSFTGHDGSVLCLVYYNGSQDQDSSSTNGILYSGGQDKIIKLWDLNNGDCIGDLQGHSGPVRTMTVHTASGLLFSGGSDRVVKIWDTRMNNNNSSSSSSSSNITAAIAPLKIPNELLCVMSYGNYVFGGLENCTVKVWDVRSMRSLKTPLSKRDPNNPPASSVFSMCTTSKYLACGSRDHTITLYHRDSLEMVQRLQPHHLDGVNSLCVVGDEAIISGSRDKTIKRWDSLPSSTTSPQQPNYQQTKIASNAHQDWVTSLVLHNGQLYSSGRDSTIKGWDPSTLLSSPTNHLLLGHESSINCIISQGSNALLSGSSDKSIKLWKV